MRSRVRTRSPIREGAPAWAMMWARLYTTGLPPSLRDARRAEIESDVFEELRSTDDQGAARRSILTRSVAGMPADVSWRLEKASSPTRIARAARTAAAGAEAGVRWTANNGLPHLTTGVAVGLTAIGLLLLATLDAGDAATQGGRTGGGILFLLAGTFMLAGTQVLPSQPRVGAALVALPALLLGLILWATVIAPLVAVAVAVSVLKRAQSEARGQRARDNGGEP